MFRSPWLSCHGNVVISVLSQQIYCVMHDNHVFLQIFFISIGWFVLHISCLCLILSTDEFCSTLWIHLSLTHVTICQYQYTDSWHNFQVSTSFLHIIYSKTPTQAFYNKSALSINKITDIMMYMIVLECCDTWFKHIPDQ